MAKKNNKPAAKPTAKPKADPMANPSTEQFKVIVKAYLDKRAEQDELFRATYAKPNKSIDECCKYIIGEGICIMPLQCVDDFYHEGEAMHHCVFSNRYYAKENSLILTAREYVGGKRLETIEIDLKTFKIIQSRGVNNGYTKKHKTIIKLMNDHMDEVRRLSRSRKRTKASERITAVA